MLQLILRSESALPAQKTLSTSGSYGRQQLCAPTVSTNHFSLLYKDASLFITDVASSNGTAVGATRLVPHVSTALHKGDVVVIAVPPTQQRTPVKPGEKCRTPKASSKTCFVYDVVEVAVPDTQPIVSGCLPLPPQKQIDLTSDAHQTQSALQPLPESSAVINLISDSEEETEQQQQQQPPPPVSDPKVAAPPSIAAPPPPPAPVAAPTPAPHAHILEQQREQLTCTICFTCLVAPHSLICGHVYCGLCIDDWIKTNRHACVCPQCRASIARDFTPVPNAMLATLVENLVPLFDAEEVEERKTRLEEWNTRKREMEAAKAKPAQQPQQQQQQQRQQQRQGIDLRNYFQLRAPPAMDPARDFQFRRQQDLQQQLQRQQMEFLQHLERAQAARRVAAPPPAGPLPHVAPYHVQQDGVVVIDDDDDSDDSQEDEDDDNDAEDEEMLQQVEPRSTRYALERARSGRSTCRTCHRLIACDSVRFIVTTEDEMSPYPQTAFHHVGCFAPFLPRRFRRDPALVPGSHVLRDAERANIRRHA
ncbi:hypothetical protein HDU98_001704 [Podochytrium sp. JEL0797]|nr:hypothetical protein HDU98_001704 [Podochytrium sp. JEL0797]